MLIKISHFHNRARGRKTSESTVQLSKKVAKALTPGETDYRVLRRITTIDARRGEKEIAIGPIWL